jgi:hypothetical protein
VIEAKENTEGLSAMIFLRSLPNEESDMHKVSENISKWKKELSCRGNWLES